MAALPADLSRVDPADAWKPWVPTVGEPWDRKRAAHLFRRAAFGATPAELDRSLKDGFPKTLERFLAGEPDAADRLELLTETGKFYTEPNNLRVWWLYAMIEGGHPLREKLALFWHNHFATSYAKVRSTKLMYEQNVLLRKHALGKFRPFLLDMSKDVAMLVWLDSNRNVKGAPNENYAREVMELFSLGVGNYTEKDVQEAARAFTGWHHDAEVAAFEDKAVLHDDGAKTILKQTGKWAGADVVRICCDQEACAKFLVGKLYTFLVSETRPPDGLLDPLAARLRKSDYDLSSLVNTILASRLFFSEHAYRKRVKWPVEYALEAVRGLVPAGRVPLADLLDPLAKMGQVLFNPPNVKGWRTGTDWLNSATLLSRNNFAETVATGQWSRTDNTKRVPTLSTSPTAPPVYLAPSDPGRSSPSPPAPPAEHDPVELVYATKPKDIPAIVRRLGEVAHGEPLPPRVAARIEQFLREPPDHTPVRQTGPPIPSYTLPGATFINPADIADGTSDTIKLSEGLPASPLNLLPPGTFGPDPLAVAPFPRPAGVAFTAPVTEAPPPRATKPPPDVASVEFKARVREALHAVMCLPEYQLN